MCGIGGFLTGTATTSQSWRSMLPCLRGRGPDDTGVVLISRRTASYRTATTDGNELADDFQYDLALVHTRYSIFDLSPAGHQPFVSQDGSVIASFNGEIYNHVELRKELEAKGVRFRSQSDTEVLVEGFRVWGDELWPRLNGFWAVALYDQRDHSLRLCRDRLGQAPLYYRETEKGLFFASNLAALLQSDSESVELDSELISGFVETQLKDYENRTCYRQIRSVPAATIVRFDASATAWKSARASTFWSLPQEHLSESDLPLSEAANRLRELLFDSVRLRLRADTSVAFELSGGLDSSSIVASAASQGHDVVSYTIRVPESNEEPYARSIRELHSIDYRVIEGTEEDFFGQSKTFTQLMQEPYHSPNIYTHFKMRQLMKREGVSVVLSGSGGDEVLAGYSDFWPSIRNAFPSRLLRLEHSFRFYLALVTNSSPQQLRDALSKRLRSLFRSLTDKNQSDNFPMVSASVPNAVELQRSFRQLGYMDQRRYHFQVANLPYYLRSNDHFTMAIPVEQRFPFLDYRLVDFGLRLPPTYFFRHGFNKYVLRIAMRDLLPQQILWRRVKMGFPFPLKRFLKRNRSVVKASLAKVEQAFMLQGGCYDFDHLIRRDPKRLWRLCSLGLWLAHAAHFESRPGSS